MNISTKLQQHKANVAVVATALALGLVVAPTSAFAALELDPAAILADIAVVVAFAVTVGLAVIGLTYTIKALGWARRTA